MPTPAHTEARHRAALTMPICVEDICAAMGALRAEGAVMNGHIDEAAAYGPAQLVVTYSAVVHHQGEITNISDECAFLEVPWDHTKWSLIEAIDAARRMGGRVYIQQNAVTPREAEPQIGPYGFWAEEVDSGFSLQIWPTFTGRNHHQEDQRADKAVFAAHALACEQVRERR